MERGRGRGIEEGMKVCFHGLPCVTRCSLWRSRQASNCQVVVEEIGPAGVDPTRWRVSPPRGLPY